MSTAQTTIGETIQAAVSLLPFEYPRFLSGYYPSSDCCAVAFERAQRQRADSSPLKAQPPEAVAAQHPASGGFSRAAPAVTHCSLCVTGEKPIRSGAGNLTSACNCLAALKQVLRCSRCRYFECCLEHRNCNRARRYCAGSDWLMPPPATPPPSTLPARVLDAKAIRRSSPAHAVGRYCCHFKH
jgi:hypothetical protein